MTQKEHLKFIQLADRAYYQLGIASVSDAIYDELRSSYIKKYGESDLKAASSSLSPSPRSTK